MSSNENVKTQEMRLIKAERSEPKRLFPCSMCVTKTKVYRRYRFILEDAKGRRNAYCLPCASYLLRRRQGDLRKEADLAATKAQSV